MVCIFYIEGEERKFFDNSRELFVCFEVWNDDSIYRWGGWWEWKSGLMVFDVELNEIDGFGMWKLTWGILAMNGGAAEKENSFGPQTNYF